MSSDEGLDAYGAVTWGQFFIYQGFNPRVGWMHTSSGVDAVDEYLETVITVGKDSPIASAKRRCPSHESQLRCNTRHPRASPPAPLPPFIRSMDP